MHEHDGLIHDSLVNYTKLNRGEWFNEEAEGIKDANISPNLDPNSGEWRYFPLPQAHRSAIFEGVSTSSSQIACFFEDVLNKVTNKNKDESVEINIVATGDTIEGTFNTVQLINLKIEVPYTNSDSNDEWEAIMDEQVKESEVSVVSVRVSEIREKPIRLKKRTFLGGILKLSRENGYIKATVYLDGKRDAISTKEHPLVDEV